MTVTKISETAQKFNGTTYYLCGHYFQRKGHRLHRAVWEYHNGAIPSGYHVHHIDGDRSNNDITNLMLMDGHEHLSAHMNTPERKAANKENIEHAREAAREWHGSPAGLEWHSKLGKENWQKRAIQTYTCSFCGQKFRTKHIYGKDSNHFCGPNCRAAFRRRRLRDEG